MNAVNDKTIEILNRVLDDAIERGFSTEYLNGIRSAIYELENYEESHGEWVCPNNNNQTALPDEQGNCSLCSATLEAGWPEQKGND